MRRLEREAEQGMSSFELTNGRRYLFDPEEAGKITFLYFAHSLNADYLREPRPEPPDLLKAVADAKDRGGALYRVMGTATHLPVDREALVERGEFLPRSLVVGRTYEEWMAEG